MAKLQNIHWIRSRASKSLPLNLHEVERERPDLLREAFALPNPTGWRATLLAAKVDPRRIVHHHHDYVACALCGFNGAVLGTHLTQHHCITPQEYFEECGAHHALSSEAFRAGRFRGKPIFGLAHWEHLWSPYYVLDWIIRLNSKGIRLNGTHLQKHGKALLGTAISYFGSWDKALDAAGIDPCNHRLIPPTRVWTHDAVIKCLRERAERSKCEPIPPMPNDLSTAIRRFFGSLENALRKTKIERSKITKRAVIREEDVLQLAEDLRGMEVLKGRERREMMAKIVRRKPINHKIIYGHYGSLQKLATSHGIDCHAVSQKVYRDSDDVHYQLDLLESRGIPLTARRLWENDRCLYKVILKSGWGEGRIVRVSPR